MIFVIILNIYKDFVLKLLNCMHLLFYNIKKIAVFFFKSRVAPRIYIEF